MADRKTGSLIAENRKAYHDYFIEERFEAGIELAGTRSNRFASARPISLTSMP
jgi:tmRNA-binding protein